jgi:retron-type reverse transcriptase
MSYSGRHEPQVGPSENGDAQAHWLRRRLRKVDKILAPQSWDDLDLIHVAHHEHLLRTFKKMRSRSGRAPGPDRVTFEQIGPREAADICRGLSQLIQSGAYRPHPSRRHRIPKTSGNGFRELTIKDLFDRVVSAAIHERLAPLWEEIFLPCSYGFRPNRNITHLLHDLAAGMVAEDRWVLAIDDIRGAFDHVVLADLMRHHRRYLKDQELLKHIEIVIRGGDEPGRKIGIAQGDPYSPTALNVILHYALDSPCVGTNATPLLRYADNLVFACRSVQEGQQALNDTRKHLARAHLALKGKDGDPVDLRGGHTAELLGYTLRYKSGRLRLGLGEDAWRELEQVLKAAHHKSNPPEAAQYAVEGWIDAHKLALQDKASHHTAERIYRTAAQCGLRELTTVECTWGSSDGAPTAIELPDGAFDPVGPRTKGTTARTAMAPPIAR